VVVTGWGMISPLGGTVDATWDAAVKGRSGVRELTLFDPRGLACRIGGEVDDAWLAPEAPGDRGERLFRMIQPAARQAAGQARLGDRPDRHRVAVVLGNHGLTPSLRRIEALARHLDADARCDVAGLAADPGRESGFFRMRCADHAPAFVAAEVDARGPQFPVVSACAAGAQAIGEGVRLLREGRADAVVAGGAETNLTFSGFLGFVLLGALAKRYPSPEKASRPFDRRRSGFVMSEGAGLVVLETLAHARSRRATVLGEVLGYGDSADAFRITDMHPEGDGAVLAMHRALADARLAPEDVEYVNAHGTSTPINDPTETLALKRVLGERAKTVPVSSNKSMLGHTIGAAGAIEAILTLRGIAEGVLLPTINYEVPDPRCDLDYVPNEARAREHRIAISNSFGFGGQNACLALGAADLS
jgi:3-oxoacyl-[acyl-carrier-protein] synthase II